MVAAVRAWSSTQLIFSEQHSAGRSRVRLQAKRVQSCQGRRTNYLAEHRRRERDFFRRGDRRLNTA